MSQAIKEFAIIAPTASGKTALSIKLAKKYDAIILSLDSLSVYKHIDIASAKPTQEERDGIVHFGIDKIEPNQKFDVMEFVQEYKEAKKYATLHNKNLIIVGGTSFYLKVLIDGISPIPTISTTVEAKVVDMLDNLSVAYEYIYKLDKDYMKNIKPTDKYRIKKTLELYFQTQTIPSEFFAKNQPKPIVKDLPIYQIETDVEVLRKRIEKRTQLMLDSGLIDEVIYLEKHYGRMPNSMKSIGIVETLEYLDGKISKKQLYELICVHTAQLAKRQRTFNKSQFKDIVSDSLENLSSKL